MEEIQNILQSIMLRTKYSAQTFDDLTAEQHAQRKADNYNALVGNLNDEDGYNCDVCRNKGMIMRPYEPQPGIWDCIPKECKCMATRNSIRRMNRSGLKDVIKTYTFNKFIVAEPWQQTIKEKAQSFALKPEGWFFIGGQSGSGKTHICTAICREFLLSGRAVKYMLWRDDAVRLKALVNDAEEYTRLMEEYKHIDVLYIDDLFKTGKTEDGYRQKPTGADINIAFEILNVRYNAPSALTIISSECTIYDLMDIDEATGGRILERAKTNVVNLNPDQAKNQRKKDIVDL